MATKKQSEVLSAALVGAMAPEGDVTIPTRIRAYSFAASVTDLNVGDQPAAKVQLIDPATPIGDAINGVTALSDKLRNSVQSTVNQAKRRVPGAEYSIEISDVMMKSGMYLLALVHRTK